MRHPFVVSRLLPLQNLKLTTGQRIRIGQRERDEAVQDSGPGAAVPLQLSGSSHTSDQDDTSVPSAFIEK